MNVHAPMKFPVDRDARRPRALEFFSGIGGFAEAARDLGIEVVAAFDQDAAANQAYVSNFNLLPNSRNLDSISAHEIPEADLWWMSPPCTPYSVRGKREDKGDPRAASLVNLIGLIGQQKPAYLMVENVLGFAGSQVHKLLIDQLIECRYHIREIDLCSTSFGTPMKRPRHFVVASRFELKNVQPIASDTARRSWAEFLDPEPSLELVVDASIIDRYGRALNLLDPDASNQVAICFTSGYWKCQKASGSFIRTAPETIRRFSPDEILKLLGFFEPYRFPDNFNLQTRFRLAGNSVDVRAVKWLMQIFA